MMGLIVMELIIGLGKLTGQYGLVLGIRGVNDGAYNDWGL